MKHHPLTAISPQLKSMGRHDAAWAIKYADGRGMEGFERAARLRKKGDKVDTVCVYAGALIYVERKNHTTGATWAVELGEEQVALFQNHREIHLAKSGNRKGNRPKANPHKKGEYGVCADWWLKNRWTNRVRFERLEREEQEEPAEERQLLILAKSKMLE